LLVRTLGAVLGATFKRIQFTPDLMPSDVTGGNVFDQKADAFVFRPGPVFTQLLLADEINRAPAKTQSSLLEAMQELSVTTDGVTRALPDPFFVIATQNPVESQGTYPLPEAQLDRFLMKLHVGYPSARRGAHTPSPRRGGLRRREARSKPASNACSSAEELVAMRSAAASRVRIDDALARVHRRARQCAHARIAPSTSARRRVARSGCSQRRVCARRAQGRDYAVPDDVKALAKSVLRHRLLLHPDAEIEGRSADDCLEEILREAKVPKTAA
jgi:MoxR-like ATPase